MQTRRECVSRLMGFQLGPSARVCPIWQCAVLLAEAVLWSLHPECPVPMAGVAAGGCQGRSWLLLPAEGEAKMRMAWSEGELGSHGLVYVLCGASACWPQCVDEACPGHS